MFFWNSLAFSMIQRMLEIWSLVPLPFLKPAWTSGSFTVHVLVKPRLENFEHYFSSVWDECNCAIVWAFFSIAFLWDWNENWPFPILWPLLSFPNLLAYWVQHFHSIIFQDFITYFFLSINIFQSGIIYNGIVNMYNTQYKLPNYFSVKVYQLY